MYSEYRPPFSYGTSLVFRKEFFCSLSSLHHRRASPGLLRMGDYFNQASVAFNHSPLLKFFPLLRPLCKYFQGSGHWTDTEWGKYRSLKDVAPLPLSPSVAAALALAGKQSLGNPALLSSSQELGANIASCVTSLNDIKRPLLTNVIYACMHAKINE